MMNWEGVSSAATAISAYHKSFPSLSLLRRHGESFLLFEEIWGWKQERCCQSHYEGSRGDFPHLWSSFARCCRSVCCWQWWVGSWRRFYCCSLLVAQPSWYDDSNEASAAALPRWCARSGGASHDSLDRPSALRLLAQLPTCSSSALSMASPTRSRSPSGKMLLIHCHQLPWCV